MQRSPVGLFVCSLLLAALGAPSAWASPEPSLHPDSPAISSSGSPPQASHKEDEILVKFREGVPSGRKDEAHRALGASLIREFKELRLHQVKLKKGTTVDEALRLYRENPDVEYAEPDFVYTPHALPNDPLFSQQWGMTKIGAPSAWDRSTGSADVVVMVIDSGVDYTHQDLAANMWVNPGEIAGNGLDDDGNGYVDDVYGIDPVNGDRDPLDDYGHGTHVAGIIGAVGNNAVGVAGVNWTVRVMACKSGSASGSYYVSYAITCLQYARTMKNRGVNIVATNNSWGGGSYSQSLYDAINAQRDILFIASAGNDNRDNDLTPVYPAGYLLPNVVAVASTTSGDNRATTSNYGRKTVHLGAPGDSVYSTLRGGSYGSMSGTSMAAPHVSGLAALLKAQNPARSAGAIRNLILSSGDTVAAMTGSTITGKRLSAARATSCASSPLLSAVQFPAAPVVGTPVTLSALSIDCESPVGPVTVTTAGGLTIPLLDDGVAPDLAAGDGLFTGTWTPTRAGELLTFTSPAGSEAVETPALALPAEYVHEATTRAPYGYLLKATGGLPPYSWALLSGTLPPGLSLTGATGEIAGLPAATGTYTLTVQVTDSLNQTKSRSLTIRVVSDPVVEAWGMSYDAGLSETCRGAALDGGGNFFLAGDSYNGNLLATYLTLKYSPSGELSWSRSYGYHTYYSANAIALDASGTAYVAGYLFGMSSSSCPILKYDPSGTLLWNRTISGSSCAAVAVDSDGSVYVTGNYNGTTSDVRVVKLDSAGTTLWTRTFDGGNSESPYGIAARGGNIYVTGRAYNGASYDVLLVKFDAAGNVLWSTTYGAAQADAGNAVAVDGQGNVLVAATSGGLYLTLKFDASGDLLWSSTYPNSYTADAAKGVAVDPEGYVYVTGHSVSSGSNYNFRTVKYDPVGNLLWAKVTDSGNKDYATGIAVDGNGSIYVGGYFTNGASNDFLAIKYREGPSIVTATLPGASRGAGYLHPLAATGGAKPYSWSVISGSLPDGLTLDSQSGVISGTPAAAGSWSFTVQLADAGGEAVSKSLFLVVDEAVSISTSSLPAGSTASSYSQAVTAAGGTPPYTWSISAGNLPGGLSLGATSGFIAGNPAGPGTFSFTLLVTDANQATASRTLAITILPVATIAGVPASPTNQTGATLTVGGTGVVAYRYRLDGSAYSAEIPVATAVSLTPLAEGAHTVSVIGRDGEGNWQDSGVATTVTWLVDLTPPVATITGIPTSPTNASSISLSVGGADVVAYRYSIDAEPWSAELPVATPLVRGSLGPGVHTCSVIGRDIAGNWQSAPTSGSWTVVIAGTSIQPLYDDPATVDGAIIWVSGDVTEEIDLRRPISVTISGGYNAGFTAVVGMTTIHGSLTISQGSATLANLVIGN